MFFFLFVIFECFCIIALCDASLCVRPNGEETECASLDVCQAVLSAITNNDSSINKFIDESLCEKAKICCRTSSNATENQSRTLAEMDKQSKREYALNQLLLSKQYCGKQHWDDYFHPENETEDAKVDEFPWLLALNNDGWCNAVLISRRYAISTPYCNERRQIQLKFGNSYQVIIGQHRITENVSCTETPYGDDCTDEKLWVNIEEYIDSPDFGISLLRLDKKITFSDYTRPICLPIHQQAFAKVNQTATISSWGYCSGTACLNDTKVHSYAKKKWTMNLVINKECEDDARQSYYIPQNISVDSIMCIEALKNSSVRYSWGQYKYGRPIMQKYRNNWYLVGIVPIITSAVRITPDIVEWILENMRD